MKFFKLIFYCLIVFCLILDNACQSNNTKKQELRIFAAASLGAVTEALIDSFQAKYDCSIKVNIASSGTLARQISQGSDADIFLSANELWVNHIDSLGLLKTGVKVDLAKNDLVLICHKSINMDSVSIDSALNIKSLIGNDRIAIGNPKHVPVGQYAQQSINYFGWGNSIEKNFITANNARSTLMLVEMGEIPFGIVYRSDAFCSNKIKVLGTFPQQSHDEIIYIACSLNPKKITKTFINFTQSQTAKSIYTKQGLNSKD